MSEEKKNLTDEERKELKEGLKKKTDEMSDEELENVAGGTLVSFYKEFTVMVGEMVSFYDFFKPKSNDCRVSQEFMSSNPSVVKVGRTVKIDGKDYTIVGTCGDGMVGKHADIRIIKYVSGNAYSGVASNPVQKVVEIYY